MATALIRVRRGSRRGALPPRQILQRVPTARPAETVSVVSSSVMPYDEKLAARIRTVLDGAAGVTEKKMFGGIAFMVGGNMCCGVVGKELMARVGPDGYEAALARPHARAMDFTGRPMKGMVYVGTEGLRTERALSAWVRRAEAFARSLPAKKAKNRDKGPGKSSKTR